MLSSWQQLSTGRNSFEAGDLREGEVQSKVLVLVGDSQGEVLALIAGAFAELKLLLADLDVWVAGSRHHLYLELLMLQIAEGDNGQSGVVLRLHQELLLEPSDCSTCPTSLATGWLACLRHAVCESTLLLVLLGSADESDRDLRVGAHCARQRLCRQHSIGELLACLCWRYEAFGCLRVVLIEVLEAIEEAQVKTCWLWAVIDEKGWIFPSFAHVEGAKIQRALLTATLFEDDGEMLLYAGAGDLVDSAEDLESHLLAD